MNSHSLRNHPRLLAFPIAAVLSSAISLLAQDYCCHCPGSMGDISAVIYTERCPFNELASGEELATGPGSLHFSECSGRCVSFHVSEGTCNPDKNSFYHDGQEWSISAPSGFTVSGNTVCLTSDFCSAEGGPIHVSVSDFAGHTVSADFNASIGTESCPTCPDCDDDGGDTVPPGGHTYARTAVVNGSVSALIKLGHGAFGKRLYSLAIHETNSMPELCTPKCLKAPYGTNNYCRIITNINGIRQVKVTEGILDVVTNAAYKYTINVYPTNGIGSTNADGTYNVSGPTVASITIENPDISMATSNRLKITDDDGLVSEYEQTANGWDLTKGNGAAKHTKKFAWSESNTLRTLTNEVRNATNGLVSTRINKFKTYSFGPRVLETVTGTGAEAKTNTQIWYTNTASYTTGLLQQVTRSDGSWQVYQYESNFFATNVVHRYPTNIISAFLNQAPTSNGTLARRIEYDYTSNAIAGAGDKVRYQPNQPRRTVEYVLDKEVSRSYAVLKYGERRDIQAVTPGAAWDASDNLVTITKFYTNGTNIGRVWTIERPDGTVEVRDYVKATNAIYKTNIVMVGVPDAAKTNITDGTKTITVHGHVGERMSRTVIDIASGITNSYEVYSDLDDRDRPRKVTYLDGTSTWTDYGCCGPINFTNREGTAFKTHRDALNRQAALQNVNLNITTTNLYDAGKNLAQRRRIGSDGSSITNVSYTYDTAGRITSSRDALGNATTFSETITNSQVIKTTTYPDGGTRIEEYYRDGQLAKVTGTAVNPVRYDYGVEQDGGAWRFYTKEIKLDATGSDTSEWVKTYKDMVGQPYKVLYADGATRQRFYNAKGQLSKEIGPDGVTTLLTYNARGEVEYTAIDVNRNGTIDFNGTDRVTQTVRTTTSNNGFNVQQTRTYVWSTNNSATSNLTATFETSTDGLRLWNNNLGLTNKMQFAFPGSGTRSETNIAPDGPFTISQFQHGQLLSTTQKDANGNQIGKTTLAYDAHGRPSASTDARDGTSTQSYDAADHVVCVSTPAPGNGQNGQATSYIYDWAGRVTQTIHPDGTTVYNVYSMKGELLTNYGSRVYPVSYAYDAQGRRTNMVTWTNFATRTGAAITSWKFDGLRGFMTNKVYADGSGPSYTYTAAGRLRTRKWARGVTTTYETNAAADQIGTTYSDGTSNVTYNLDRLGRRTNVVDGAGTRILSYSSSGLLLLETNTSGVLAGTAVGYQYDQLNRRTNLAIITQPSTLNHSYSYDSASRLSTASDGAYNATYDYLANSPLVSQITYKSNATVRMTTTEKYDFLDRLVDIYSVPSASSAVKFSYAYNDANQRVRRTDSDDSYWSYEYDSLGQVVTGKHFWPDGTAVAGQQFEYGYDDIGNRRKTKEGGDASGSGLRTANYTVNNLNQYAQRDIPGAADIIGIAHPSASATVNAQAAYRHGEYYQKELAIDNSSAVVWQSVTNQAMYNGQTNTTTGNLLLAKTPQIFWYDNDGNMLSDFVWTNSWDGENRVIATENPAVVPSAGRAKQTWTFDAEGRWVQRVTYSWSGSAYTAQSTNRLLWDGKVLLAMLDHTNGLVMSFVRGLDLSRSLQGLGGAGGLLVVDIKTNGVYFCGYDGNGNVETLTSGKDGSASGRYEFDPFGSALQVTGATAKANPMRFSTQFANDLAGIRKYLYRDLHLTGRWLSRDPIEEEGGIHLYAFAHNDSVTHLDSLGTTCQCAIGWGGPPRTLPRCGPGSVGTTVASLPRNTSCVSTKRWYPSCFCYMKVQCVMFDLFTCTYNGPVGKEDDSKYYGWAVATSQSAGECQP